MSKKYIECAALIETLRGSALAKYPQSFAMGLIAAADEVINQAAVDVVEVKHGRWLYVCNAAVKCSCCSAILATRSNYCPNCGAKMDGER